MAYFAELDDNNIVLSVISVHNNELLVDGVESEEKGVAFCNTIKSAKWVKTSFNGTIRKDYAIVGGSYDEEKDIFIKPKPFASWILNENNDWQAPIDYPSDENFYYWDEGTFSWVPIPDAE
jgi:hypothetical protein